MNNWFSKIQKGLEDAGKKRQEERQHQSQNPVFRNPFARNPQHNRGGGKSLGGALPGRIIRITLSEAGPLGVKVEKRASGKPSAIVSSVIPNSQAEQAGLKRGDVICHLDTNGQEEVSYNDFLKHAANTRPLIFDVRRVDASIASNSGSSADAYARKQAMIAAAEARDRDNRQKYRSSKPTKSVPVTKSSVSSTVTYDHTQQPLTEESRKAIQQTKKDEQLHATKLGYNPYETARMNSGQAKTATVNKTHGVITDSSSNISDNANSTDSQGQSLGAVRPPNDVLQPEPSGESNESHHQDIMEVNEAFDEAFITLVTTSSLDNVLKSLSIMRILIINATTKGQSENGDDTETAAKFRRVRLSNPKIKETITDMNGAIDVMMACGFVLSENEADGDTYLVFPPGTTGPTWLPLALAKMERYCKEKN